MFKLPAKHSEQIELHTKKSQFIVFLFSKYFSDPNQRLSQLYFPNVMNFGLVEVVFNFPELTPQFKALVCGDSICIFPLLVIITTQPFCFFMSPF
jgi:hypothetical protein